MSVWVEMIYSLILPIAYLSHAPRERVSWNFFKSRFSVFVWVTLHVSVWVEMKTLLIWASRFWSHAPRERVSWNSVTEREVSRNEVTLHVSVWVEMVISTSRKTAIQSRSTWACELKCKIISTSVDFNGHAPRERVSWNVWCATQIRELQGHAPRERVSWNCLQKSFCRLCQSSRSTWACELKCEKTGKLSDFKGHAPRERVSWNILMASHITMQIVTLHVSVWVEIFNAKSKSSHVLVTLHVSVWVEMKLFTVFTSAEMVTLHVSVWVEIQKFVANSWLFSSRSTWACELKCNIFTIYCLSLSSRSTWACELKFNCSFVKPLA